MKNKRIMDAYDTIIPNPADKQRMLDAILAEAQLEEAPHKEKRLKEPIVYTKKQSVKPNRGSVFGTLAAVLALIFIAAFALKFLFRQPEDVAYTAPVEPIVTGTAYDAVLNKYQSALQEGWTAEQCQIEDISEILSASEYGKTYIGYQILDLDKNGREELIISDGDMVVDLYTLLEDATPVHILSYEGDNVKYRVCDNGVIIMQCFEKKESEWSSFRLQENRLTEDQMLMCVDNEWFVLSPEAKWELINREQAHAIMEQHTPLKLELALFASNSKDRNESKEESPYDLILKKYETALLENWTWEQCEQNDISSEIMDESTIRNNLGWCLFDIDKNGVEELVISDGVNLFDLYVMQHDNVGPGHLIMAHGGMRYTLCKDGTIEQRDLYSKGSSWSYYTLSDGELTLEGLLVYRNEYEGTTSTERYYYGTDEDNVQPISKDEAGKIIVNENKSSMVLKLNLFVAPESIDTDEGIYYQNLLELYQTALYENWHPATCMENGLSLMVAHRGEYYDDLGYTMMDLDGNGIEELIITDGRNIYDLYTIIQDETTGPLKLAAAMERLDYYLIQNNHIFYRGSGGAARQVYCHYELDGTKLTLLEGYGFDADTDPLNPWFFHDGEEYGDPCVNFDPQPIIDSYEIAEISFIPFE